MPSAPLRGLIVHDEVKVEPRQHACFDLVEELAELGGAMAPVASANDASGGNIEGGEQKCGAMPFVVISPTGRLAGAHSAASAGCGPALGFATSRPPICEDADAADGDRGALSPPRTTRPKPGHKIHPLPAARHGDHTTELGLGDGHHLHPDGERLRLSRGSAGLATRRVLSWRLSITMEAVFYVETLKDALSRHDKPDIFNTGTRARSSPARLLPTCSRTTASRSAWTRRYTCGPMTARVRPAARSADISTFNNNRRPHSSLDGSTPGTSLLHPAVTPHDSLTRRRLTYRRGNSVQTTWTSSLYALRGQP